MTAELDQWLATRAARGDQRALELLLEGSRQQLLGVCRNWTSDGADVDDLFQVVVAKLWHEIQRGSYNPRRCTFVAFASVVARDTLRTDKVHRHARKRWPTEPLTSLDHLADVGWEAPSWSLAVDPLRVVLAREAFCEAVQALTVSQLAAVNAYQASGGTGARAGKGLSSVTASHFCDARKRAHPILAEVMGQPLRLV